MTMQTQKPLIPVFLTLMVLCLAAPAGAVIPGLGGPDSPPTLAPMLEQVMPAVVNISTRTRIRMQENPLLSDPFFRRFFNVPQQPLERETQSLGSGVIVDAAKGYILTNNHVVDKADQITVKLRDERSVPAKLIGQDKDVDLAVIQIEADGLAELPLADSDALRVGDFVVAIGNPFGLGQTVTSGIVSALGRSGLGLEGYEDFIQTDAPINPGNSGGALLDLEGRLVGINTAIVGPGGGNVGIGFAIPSNMARRVMHQLIKYGEVRRGQLGVYIQDLTPGLAKAFNLDLTKGAVISQIIDGSAAAKAGLRAGDVITAVDGEPVKDAADLRNTIGLMRPGAKVTLEVYRDGKQQRFEVKLSEKHAETAAAGEVNDRLEGVTLGPIAPDHPLHGRIEGVQVMDVDRGSAGWQAGLRSGDVIVSINRRPVKDLQEADEALRKAEGGILLKVRRGQGALFILIH